MTTLNPVRLSWSFHHVLEQLRQDCTKWLSSGRSAGLWTAVGRRTPVIPSVTSELTCITAYFLHPLPCFCKERIQALHRFHHLWTRSVEMEMSCAGERNLMKSMLEFSFYSKIPQSLCTRDLGCKGKSSSFILIGFWKRMKVSFLLRALNIWITAYSISRIYCNMGRLSLGYFSSPLTCQFHWQSVSPLLTTRQETTDASAWAVRQLAGNFKTRELCDFNHI